MSAGSTLLRGAVHGLPGRDRGVLVEGGVVTWVGEGRPPRRPDEEIVAAPGETIAPGFIDLQVNGFAGHDAAGGSDAIAAISDALFSLRFRSILTCTIGKSALVPDGLSKLVGVLTFTRGQMIG